MKIKIINDNKIVAIISFKELESRKIGKADILNPHSPKLESLFMEILQTASKEDDFSFTDGIVAFGMDILNDMAIITITQSDDYSSDDEQEPADESRVLSGPNENEWKREESTTIFRFNNLGELFSLAEVYDGTCENELYEDEDKDQYYLIFKRLKKQRLLQPLFTECNVGEPVRISEAYVKEHFSVFIKENALETLKKVSGKAEFL